MVVGDDLGEGCQHTGHVLEPIPAAHLHDKRRICRRRRLGLPAGEVTVPPDAAPLTTPTLEFDQCLGAAVGCESDEPLDAGDRLGVEEAVLQ